MTVRENMEFALTRVLKITDQSELDKKVENTGKRWPAGCCRKNAFGFIGRDA
jgi:hypothetical protein